MSALPALFVVLGLLPEGPSARLSFQPEQAVVGQPVELVLEVTHGPDDPLAWATLEPELDPSWVLFASERVLQGPADEARGVARRVWRIASLEPGPRRAPEAFRAALEAAGVLLVGLEPVLEVSGVLAEGEDEPRPLRGFPGDPDGERADGAGWLRLAWPLAAALSPLLFGLALFLRGTRASGPAALAPRAELERLRTLERTGAEARGAHFALSRLVRSAADERLGTPRAGLTDEEWLARTVASGALGGAAGAELGALFARLAAVKYAGERPSPWAVDEAFASAQRVLEHLDAPAEARA